MWRAGLDLLWPRLCAVCGDECSGMVHQHCLQGLDRAVDRADAQAPVHACFEDGPGWFRLLHAWKYGGRRPLVAVVAGAMLQRPLPGLDRSVLVPMPDDPARRLERGYSPVMDLVTGLAHATGTPVGPGLVRRRRPAPSQTTCADDGARRSNVRELFAAGDLARWSKARRLVLVDDQVTSGATVLEAARILRCRGHEVAVWCAARARRAPTRCLDGVGGGD